MGPSKRIYDFVARIPRRPRGFVKPTEIFVAMELVILQNSSLRRG